MKLLCVLCLILCLLDSAFSGNLPREKELQQFPEEQDDYKARTIRSVPINKAMQNAGIGCIPHPSCVFPFKYKDVTHSSCSDANNNGKYWCSPTAEYVSGSKTDLPCDCIGCMPHPSCIFPFTYKQVKYTACTDANNNGKYWCSPTVVYAVGSGTDLPCDCNHCLHPSECQFPFLYRGKEYHHCTQVDSYGGEFWCSHDRIHRYKSPVSNCTCYGK